MNILAIDLGSHQIKAAIVKASNNRLDLLSQASVATAGIRVGKVTSMDKASSSIAQVIEKVRENISIHIDKTVVSVNGAYLKSYTSRAKLTLETGATISINDIKKALENAKNQAAMEADEVALHVLPYRFYASGATIVEDPLGMCSSSFMLDAHIVCISQDALNNIRRILELAGVSNYELVSGIYADAIYILRDDEKERNVAIVNMGHETCQIAVYIQNSIAWLECLPFGAGSISGDLVEVFKMQEEVAKKLKTDHIHYEDNDNIAVYSQDGNEDTLKMGLIRKVIDMRIQEMLDTSHGLLRVGEFGKAYTCVAFTGGTFNIPLMKERAKPKFDNMPVRVHSSVNPRFAQSEVRSLVMPEYSCLFGLCMYGAGYHTNYELDVRGLLKTYHKVNAMNTIPESVVDFNANNDLVAPELNLNNSLNLEQDLLASNKEQLLDAEPSLKIDMDAHATSQPSAWAKFKAMVSDKVSGLF